MGRRASKIYAPFNDEQVRNLNRFQQSKAFFVVTCHSGHAMAASVRGWECPVDHEHGQNWAWDFMADGRWLDSQEASML